MVDYDIEKYQFLISLGNTRLSVAFHFSKTYIFFKPYIISRTEDNCTECISLQEILFEDWLKLGNETIDSYAEYNLLSITISEKLLLYNHFIIHAVAFYWHGKAWLITAPPSTGKSTQYKNLKDIYPNEISIINGDRPVLEVKEDGCIMVHPSPWNGKEGWKGAEAAPLGGIICLKQGKENKIQPLPVKDSSSRIYASIFQSFQDENIIKKVASMSTAIIKKYPIWLLTNLGDYASSKLLYKTIADWESQNK